MKPFTENLSVQDLLYKAQDEIKQLKDALSIERHHAERLEKESLKVAVWMAEKLLNKRIGEKTVMEWIGDDYSLTIQVPLNYMRGYHRNWELVREVINQVKADTDKEKARLEIVDICDYVTIDDQKHKTSNLLKALTIARNIAWCSPINIFWDYQEMVG